MSNNTVYITVIAMYILAILALFAIFVVFVLTVIDIYEKRYLKWIYAKISALLVSAIVLVMAAPWWLLAFAFKENDLQISESLYNMAIKTSIFPSVKSFMYSALGTFHSMNHNGAKAIDAFEKSYALKNNPNSLVQLCVLYTIKGEHDSAIANCVMTQSNQMVAVNGILNKNYHIALNLMDSNIKSASPTCWDYAMRAHIHRAIGENGLFDEDFKKAFELCPDNSGLKTIYNNNSYYEDLYSSRRKEYHF